MRKTDTITSAQQDGQTSLLGNLLTLARAGDLLGGVPAATLRGFIAAGRLDAVRVGRRWLVTRESLDHLLARGRQIRLSAERSR
jgi:excisionase family DNA binding protein